MQVLLSRGFERDGNSAFDGALVEPDDVRPGDITTPHRLDCEIPRAQSTSPVA